MGSKMDGLFFGHLVYIKNEVTKEFGTGTLICNESSWYILTASHVIKKADSSSLYLNLGIPHGSRLEKTSILIDEPVLDYALIEVDVSEANIKLGEKTVLSVLILRSRLENCQNSIGWQLQDIQTIL